MDRSTFERELCNRLEDTIPGVSFSMDKVNKIQKSYDGIIAEVDGSGIGICLDLDYAFRDYVESGDFDAVVEKTVCTAKMALAEAPDVSFITDFNSFSP